MSDTATPHTGNVEQTHGSRPARLVKELIRRTYGVVVILVVAFLSYNAFHYLVVTLIAPPEVPGQIEGLPLRMDQATLRTAPSRWEGITATEHPRVPLAHYHQYHGWFQPDTLNDCTRSGCHTPLPHAKRKENRAFLNMHATSLHCGVCHLATNDSPLPLVWYDLRDGRPTEPPALLRAYGWLLSDEGQAARTAPTAAAQHYLAKLLDEAARQAGGDPELLQLVRLIRGPRHTSQAFVTALDVVRERLPLHFRGEYGAKLALRDPHAGAPLLGHAGSEEAVQEYLQRGETLDPAARAALLERVHPARRTPTLVCTDCHREAGALVELSAVGYPAPRIQALYRPWIFQTIEHMGEGEVLHLPQFVVPETLPAATRPAGRGDEGNHP